MAKSNLVALDREINKKVRDKVEEEINKTTDSIRQELGLENEDDEADDQTQPPDTSTSIPQYSKQVIKKAFSSFPSSEGFYGKIWKVRPDGTWEAKDHTITAPETIPDLEQEIVRLVHDKGWGEGKYQVQIRNYADKRGFKLNQSIIVGEYTPQEKRERSKHGVSPSSESVFVDPVDAGMKIMDKVLATSKAMTPTPQPQMDLVKMAEINASTFRTGVEVATQAARGSGSTDNASSMVQLITALKDIFKPAEPKDDLIRTLTILKEIGIIGQPVKQVDDLERFGAIKNALGLKYAHEVEGSKSDPMKMIETVGTLITALKPLVNPDMTPPTTFQMVLEAFGKYGGPLFDTFRDFAEAKKLEVQMRMNPGTAPPPAIRRSPSPPLAQNTQSSPQNGGKSQVNILTQIAEIVKSGDESKFNFLRETIYGFLGPQWIQGLISGEVSVDYIVTLSKMQFGDAFDNEQSKMYLYKFVSWMREQVSKAQTTQPSPNIPDVGENVAGGVAAKCQNPTCGMEWDLTRQEWSESKICDKCGGPLMEIRIAEQPSAQPVIS